MVTSIFDAVHGPLAWATIVCAAIAALLLLYYLVRRPPLTTATKLLLLMGLVIFPIAAAMSGNIVGFERTTERGFCNGCHVMEPWIDDSTDPTSQSLAAMHTRNQAFGTQNCYTCHADYGLYGVVVTKMNGMGHFYMYHLKGYSDMTLDEAIGKIHINKPFPNATCIRCHSMTLAGFNDEPEHTAAKDKLARGEVTCASAGCHGPAHPFSKTKEKGGPR